MSEVSSSMQSHVLLFSCGGQSHQEEALRSSLRVQNLDVMLETSPRHQPHRTTRKGFNGEPARLVVVLVMVVVVGQRCRSYDPLEVPVMILKLIFFRI